MTSVGLATLRVGAENLLTLYHYVILTKNYTSYMLLSNSPTVIVTFQLVTVMEPTLTLQLYCPESTISRGEKEYVGDV